MGEQTRVDPCHAGRVVLDRDQRADAVDELLPSVPAGFVGEFDAELQFGQCDG